METIKLADVLLYWKATLISSEAMCEIYSTMIDKSGIPAPLAVIATHLLSERANDRLGFTRIAAAVSGYYSMLVMGDISLEERNKAFIDTIVAIPKSPRRMANWN